MPFLIRDKALELFTAPGSLGLIHKPSETYQVTIPSVSAEPFDFYPSIACLTETDKCNPTFTWSTSSDALGVSIQQHFDGMPKVHQLGSVIKEGMRTMLSSSDPVRWGPAGVAARSISMDYIKAILSATAPLTDTSSTASPKPTDVLAAYTAKDVECTGGVQAIPLLLLSEDANWRLSFAIKQSSWDSASDQVRETVNSQLEEWAKGQGQPSFTATDGADLRRQIHKSLLDSADALGEFLTLCAFTNEMSEVI